MEINCIYNEDCMETMKRMSDGCVDIVFTSPPYNRKRNDKYKFYNDITNDYFFFLKTVINECLRITKKNVFINIQKNYYNKVDVFKLIGYYAEKICELIVWEKSNPLPAPSYYITNSYEFVIVLGNQLRSNTTYTKNHITTSVAKMPKEHKAVMNKEFCSWIIKKFTSEGNIIYDPFIGLGTVAEICWYNNRFFIGSEISKEYYNMAYKKINCLKELLI